MVGDSNSKEYTLQRDYVATTVGKEVQLECKMKDLLNEDDKVTDF
jgi:hypothetical protein